MGMMARRNIKARGVFAPRPAIKEEKAVEKRIVEEVVEEVVDETPLSEKIRMAGLSKTEINRTSTAELQKMANQFGVDGADEMSGNQIKKLFIGALGEE